MLRPRQVPLGRIGRDADDLGVQCGVLGLFIPELGEFAFSAAGERLDEERDDDEVALRQRLAELERPPVLVAERDLRSLVVDRERLVAIGRQRRRHDESRRGQKDGEYGSQRFHELSTAWSTAPRKSGSGNAPSNWTRSLMTTFGTPITW